MLTISDAVRQRKSIRAFKPDPVPRETLAGILERAVRSPSAGNIQPWEIHVVTGEMLEGIKRGNVEKLSSLTVPAPDVVINSPVGIYKERRKAFFAQLYDLLGIAREDKAGRFESLKDGFRFYDAPLVIILSADRRLDEARTQFDLGLLTQTICLLALEHDLGTCIQIGPVMYPDVIRRFLPIPDSKRITASIAVGYPNWDAPVNSLESRREPLDSVVSWYGFASTG